MKLLFFIASLQCGGAQRVSVTLCNHWAERGWDVTIATLDDGTHPPFFPLVKGVRHVALGLVARSTGIIQSVIHNVRRVRRLRTFVALERPELILSFIDGTNVLALLAAMGTGIPVVVSERTDPSQHSIPWAWRILRRMTYPMARAIVLQTKAAAAYFPASWASRIAIVPNPVSKVPPRAQTAGAEVGGAHRIVGMGRLEKEKGFDHLIRAFASAVTTEAPWELTILGDGPERDALENEIARLASNRSISLPGWEPDARGVLQRSDMFVLSSRYEGFPNALCEAMACGLPVVAFDCPSGPAEIVRDGVDGLLVPAEDEVALAGAIARLISDPAARQRMGTRAAEVSDRFSLERIASLWERVLMDGAV